MKDSLPYICFDFTPGGVAFRRDYIDWLRENCPEKYQAMIAKTDSPKCTADPVHVEELEVSEVMS